MRIFALVLSVGFVTGSTLTGQSQANRASAQLSGRVFDEGTGAPISSARVLLFPQPRTGPGPVPQTITDQSGRYVFEGLPAGRYRVDAEKSGFLPPVDLAKVPIATVPAGQVIDDWNVSLRKGGVIAGRILDQFGEPLVDVSVRAFRQVRPGAIPSQADSSSPLGVALRAPNISTNDLGEFRVFGLAPGEYLLAATPQPRFGFQSSSIDASLLSSTFYPGVSDASTAQMITVSPGETVGNVEFRLVTAAGFRVSGTVVDQAGTTIAGAMVMLRGDPRSPVAILGPAGQSSSDENGRFVLGNIPSGSYFATAIPVARTIESNGIQDGLIIDEPQTLGTDPVEVVVSDADVEGITLVVRPRQ